MKKTFLISLFLSMGCMAFSEEISLEKAIDMALENSREIKISERKQEIAKKNISYAFKLALPSVTYTGQYQKGEYERSVGTVNKVNSKDGFTQSIGISQPIYQGGVILGAIRGSKIYEDNSELSYLATKRDLRLEVITIYSNIIKNKRDIAVLETSKKELLARLERQKNQYEMRLIVKTDLLKTEYSLLDVETKIDKAKSDIKILTDNLKLKLRVSPDEKIDVVDFKFYENAINEIDFANDLVQAKEKSINALLSKNNVELSEIETIQKRANLLPKVDGFLKYGNYAEQERFSQTTENGEWRGGVSVSWNIFQFGKDIDQYSVSKMELENQKLNSQITLDNIELNLNSAYLNLLNFEKQKDSLEKAVKAAEENFNMDQERYDAGIISTVDYLSSETKLRESKVNYNKILIEYFVAFEKYRSLLI